MSNALRGSAFGNGMIIHNQRLKSRGVRNKVQFYFGGADGGLDFPRVVETVVPKGGLGKTLDAMHEFHKLHGIDAHTGEGRRDKNGRDYIRWCFTNPGIAAKFKSEFVRGGAATKADKALS
jgi:hypothetical protein